MTNILYIDGLNEGKGALVDIDGKRLEQAHQISEKLSAISGSQWRIRSSADCREVLAGGDFLINMIEGAGMAYIAVPQMQIKVTQQRYTCLEVTPLGGRYRFESLEQEVSTFMAELAVDQDGLVLEYPGLFRRTETIK